MITRSAPCSILDWRYARKTAAQWPECRATWSREMVSVTVDAPQLHPADEACLAEQIIDAVGTAARLHSFVKRAP